MDLNSEGHQERGQVKNHRNQSDVPGEEGEEIKSPKRIIIRVESEETHHYVREAKGTDQEEAEELSFVPSAISVPQKLTFRCDNQCSEKTLSFWQLASVVIQEGWGISHDQYMPEMLQRFSEGKRRNNTDKLAVGTVRGAKGAPWKVLEDDGKISIRPKNVGVLLPRQAEEEKQTRIQGQWQLESPAKEFLEQVESCDDTDCTENDEAGLRRPEKWRLGRIQKHFQG